MKIQKTMLSIFLALIVLGLSSSMVVAGDVNDYIDGAWLGFSFNTVGEDVYGCKPADPGGLPCGEFPGHIMADAPPWTFTAPGRGVMFTVTDAFNSGDQFEIFDSGVSIGSTSDPQLGENCWADAAICLSNPAMSSGAFRLEAGEHSITIKLIKSPWNAGMAYFRLDVATPDLTPILGLIEAIENLVLEGKLNDVQAGPLVKKLEKISEKFNLGKISSGCSKLDDFVFEVIDLIDDNVLSLEDGEPLIDAVYQIQENLDCLSYQDE